jgi:hypothetical protein
MENIFIIDSCGGGEAELWDDFFLIEKFLKFSEKLSWKAS